MVFVDSEAVEASKSSSATCFLLFFTSTMKSSCQFVHWRYQAIGSELFMPENISCDGHRVSSHLSCSCRKKPHVRHAGQSFPSCSSIEKSKIEMSETRDVGVGRNLKSGKSEFHDYAAPDGFPNQKD